MPRRISRLGGTTLRRSFMTNAYSPAIYTWGPRNGPQTPIIRAAPAKPWRPSISGLLLGPRDGPPTPIVRAAPAKPWRPLVSGLLLGARDWPPNPPTFGPPRRSRGGPLFQAAY